MAVLQVARKPVDALDGLGGQLRFYGRSLAWTPRTLRRYKKEILRLLGEVALGTGALTVIGGTVGVIAFLAFFTGTEVGLQGYSALNQIGTSAFAGFVSAYINTREIGPLIAAIVACYKGMNAAGGPKGVGDAVNESVVITFMLLFVVNFVMSAIYFQLVPPKTG